MLTHSAIARLVPHSSGTKWQLKATIINFKNHSAISHETQNSKPDRGLRPKSTNIFAGSSPTPQAPAAKKNWPAFPRTADFGPRTSDFGFPIGSFLRYVEVFTHLQGIDARAYCEPSRMATDAEVRNLSTNVVCLRSTNEWSVAQIVGPAVWRVGKVAGAQQAGDGQDAEGVTGLETADTARWEVRVRNLRRAYDKQNASPGKRWSRLPNNLPTSARLHFLIP